MTTTNAAFLFADLVGFTAFTEKHGDEAAADLALSFCDRVCELNRSHRASDVKLLGDASLIYAPEPALAVDLALHIVDEIGPAAGFPKVRVGGHFGPAVERSGDWFGTTVNAASRIVSIAEEGVVVVTGAIAEAAADLPGVKFEAAGKRRLRGLSTPLALFRAIRVAEPTSAHVALGLSK